MKTNRLLRQITGSPIHSIADQVRLLQSRGVPVVALQTGDPDFATPEPIIRSAHQAMLDGLTHYADSRGLPGLRAAISAKLAGFNGLNYDPISEVLVTCSGSHACLCALHAVCDPGDEVLIPDPCWPVYENILKINGCCPVYVPGKPENGFFPTIEDFEKSITEKTAAILINTPNNPTGMIASQEYLQAVVDFACRHDLYILSDEVYESIIFSGLRHISLASLPGAWERTFVMNSFSKTYAMTGWRIGYLAGPTELIQEAHKVCQTGLTNIAPFIQVAAQTALTDLEVPGYVDRMIAAYDRRRKLAMDILNSQSDPIIQAADPQGAFYLFLDLSRLGQTTDILAARLLEEEQVAVIPGGAFGPYSKNYIRITIAAADAEIETGLTRLVRWATRQMETIPAS